MPKHFAEVLVLMNGEFSASRDEVSSYVWCKSLIENLISLTQK